MENSIHIIWSMEKIDSLAPRNVNAYNVFMVI